MNLILSVFQDIFISMLSALTLAFAFLSFINKRLVQSVLFFVLMVICFSFALLLYKPLYIGVLYIIVYIGAVAVLFLFVLMLVNLREETLNLVSQKDDTNFYSKEVPFTVKILAFIIFAFNFFLLVDSQGFTLLPIDLDSWTSFALINDSNIKGFVSGNLNLKILDAFAFNQLHNIDVSALFTTLINLTDSSVVNDRVAINFLNDLSNIYVKFGLSGLKEVLMLLYSEISSYTNVNLVYSFSGLEDSTTLVTPLFLNKNSTLLYGAGSLLLLALIGSVYITKDNN